MGAWVRVAEFTKAKHLKGGLVARSVAGLPFLLEEGLFCAFVPPVIDVPRQGTVVEVRPEARGGATVFFDTVVDANQADALVGCYVLARREDLPDDVLELQEGGNAANLRSVHKYVTGVSEESQRTCSLKYDG